MSWSLILTFPPTITTRHGVNCGQATRHMFADLLELGEELGCGTLGCAMGEVEDCGRFSQTSRLQLEG